MRGMRWRATEADVRPVCCGTEWRVKLDEHQPEGEHLGRNVLVEGDTQRVSVHSST